MDLWTFGGVDKFTASTWFGLCRARLKVVVLQPTVISSFGCFVFKFWVIRFRDLGALCFDLETIPHLLVFSMQHYLLPFHPLTTNDTLHK